MVSAFLNTARLLLSRLRWDPRDEAIPSRDRATVARTFVYLYGLGGSLVLASLAIAEVDDRWWPGVAIPAVLACAVSVVLLVGFDRLPWWFFVALPSLGAVLITMVVSYGGIQLVTVYATLYFWVMLSAAFFFSVRITIFNLAWIALLYGGVLALNPAASHHGLRWLMVLGTLAVLAAVIGALRGRAERLVETVRRRARKQETIAELGRQALGGAEPTEIAAMTADAVAAGLNVGHAAVFSGVPDTDRLLVRAGKGWPRAILQGATVTTADPLLSKALDSSEPVVIERYSAELRACGYEGPLLEVNSAIAVRLGGEHGPVGVLAAYSRERQSFGPTEADFLQSAAHVLGEADERRRVGEEREHRAMHDRLTGRPNRWLFMDRLDEALTRVGNEGSMLAVLLIDLDDFKLVNDGFGHSAGDELLKAVGPRLREGLVMTDTVARFGGDEFVILCEDVQGESHAIEIAERLRTAIARPFQIKDAHYRVSASIGVALTSGEDDGEELIAHADAAMYRAKEKSRGSYEFFDQELRNRVRLRLEFESALRAAPEEDQLRLVVQPIVALPGGEPVGGEALLRWEHPEHGPVSPADFIPVAEETGAILPIGDWVLKRAFEIAARWRSDPYHRRFLPLHVNLSARQLAHHELVVKVERWIAESGVRVRDLSFEITEHALLGNADDTVQTLEDLQGMGIAIVLDDFGTGYSSLSHLKQFPIDIVKVDRGFISNLTEEKRDEAIVSAVLGMADAFALDVVAEGIETPDQVERLAQLGCRFGQGFYFAKPMPHDRMKMDWPQPTQSAEFSPSESSASALDA